MTGRPSKFFEEMVKARPAFVDFPGTLIQGGVPVMHDNECVAGIGVSGVQSHEDEQIAQAGAKALEKPRSWLSRHGESQRQAEQREQAHGLERRIALGAPDGEPGQRAPFACPH